MAESTKNDKNDLQLKKVLESLPDNLNKIYFQLLNKKRLDKQPYQLKITEHLEDSPESSRADGVYPTAIAPPHLMKALPYVKYNDLVKNTVYTGAAKTVSLWLMKMHGGTGSSVARKKYLSQKKGIPIDKVTLGAKGTDLFLDLDGETLSLAEAQVVQAIVSVQQKKIASVIFQDIVGPETKNSLKELWSKKCFLDSSITYKQFLDRSDRLHYSGETYQEVLPTLTKEKNWTQNRTAPGGHGIFGVHAFAMALEPDKYPLPKTSNENTLIASIGNGEDFGSTPDAAILGWMKVEKIPVAMILTDKTSIDLKGGQLAIVQKKNEPDSVCLIEKAQAESAGQIKLFEELGLRKNDAKAFFNTNLALFNFEVLSPLLQKASKEIGTQKLMEALSPDLISNWKEQVDSDGVTRKYLQLEGAMGSVLLNLDKFWRKTYNQPLVHFVEVPPSARTKFFMPVKTAFDFFMLFHSDRFTLNRETMQLEDQGKKNLPAVELKNSFYSDVSTVLEVFENSKIRHMESLSVEGKVDFRGMTLEGEILIESEASSVVILKKILDSTTLKDAHLKIDRRGKLISKT